MSTLLSCAEPGRTHSQVRTSQTFVKKKAALTLLRLYRKHPEVVPAAEWALRLVSIMDDHDLVCKHSLRAGLTIDTAATTKGVVICVTSLVMALAQDHLDAYAVCYTKAVDRLHKVSYSVDMRCTYSSACSWLLGMNILLHMLTTKCLLPGCKSNYCACCSTTHPPVCGYGYHRSGEAHFAQRTHQYVLPCTRCFKPS